MEKDFIFKGKRISSVGFFGFGRSNRALFEYLMGRYRGLKYVLRSDADTVAADGFSLLRLGSDAMLDISEDVLFLSPSVRKDREPLLIAEENGTVISSDTEFFFEAKKIPTLAVTGSDGKSTTAAMASLMLTDSLGSFPPSANIGTPLTELIDNDEIAGTVAELSSFQLMNFEPPTRRALITNLTENHLDWHKSLREYISAKENILRRAEERVFNLDCDISRAFLEKYPAFAVYSTALTLSQMKKIAKAEHYFNLENGYISSSGKPIIHKDELSFTEKHNIHNFVAATALCHGLVCKRSILRAAKEFKPLPHRAQLVLTHNGISFYDSSIDSTPSRTRATLSSFKAPTVLILGGRSKNLSYKALFPLPSSVKAIVITGENRAEIQRALFSERDFAYGKIPVHYAEPFSEAVAVAIGLARSGDAVLLSPASTSFDSFSDYRQRGNAFTEIIKKYYSAD